MSYLTVIILAAAAGGAVAAFTLWEGRPRPTPAVGAAGTPAPQAHALPSTPTVQTRMIGALGLLVAILAGAGLIAAVCYLAYVGVKHALG
jgi:hypothetical protein